MTFLKGLMKMIILSRRRSCAEDRYKSKKVNDFSLSQNVGLVRR